MIEVWEDIEGYEGRYKVSNLGNVKTSNYKNSGNEQKVKLCNDKDGYLLVNLRKNKKVKTFRVHRLVAQAFILNKEEKSQVNHKDGNKKNNNSENLEWVTHKENQAHAWESGLKVAPSEELRKRMSKKMKGKNNPLYGKKLSEETKMKISKSKQGKPGPNKGRRMSEEQKEKISNSKKMKIILLNNNEIYSCAKEASKKTGINISTIKNGLRIKSKRGGIINGEPALWEYIQQRLRERS